MKSPCFYLLTFFFFFTSSEFECFPIYLVLVRENYIFLPDVFPGVGGDHTVFNCIIRD